MRAITQSRFSIEDHSPVCRLDIRRDIRLRELATGHGYPKTVFKRELDMDQDIRTLLSMFRGFRLLENVPHCTIIDSLSSEASFQHSVP